MRLSGQQGSREPWGAGEMLEDPLFWVLVLPGLLLGTYAQWRIKANVAKYSQVSTKDGVTGAEVARRLLNSQGLQDVKVEATPGMLTDHYDPRTKILRLSQDAISHRVSRRLELPLTKRGMPFRMRRITCRWRREHTSCRSCSLPQELLHGCSSPGDAADAIPDVGWRDFVRFVIPIRIPHLAG